MRQMKSLILATAVLLVAASCTDEKPAGASPDETAAYALCERILGPGASKNFLFRSISDTTDVFVISSEEGKTVIEGNNANSMATGLNYYLKYKCNLSLGFLKPERISLPSKLPIVEDPIRIQSVCPARFFLNYCTFGYSMPWWNWEEWEYFIDWMAMNGINLVLSITGQESIWYKVWTELGMDGDYVRSYFTGPSHLPWHRMSNIDEWGGPLPVSWLEGQEALQKKIVARERELNMKTVLPAFAGHVPDKLAEMYPDSKIDKLGEWGGFSEEEVCSFLDPTDPLYAKIQKSFLEKQTEIYGTDHIYGVDLFNEVTPPSWEPDYLAMVGKHVYQTLAAADPEAIWLQMTWLFYYKRHLWTDERVKSFITSYPAEKSILLDYYCENMEVWKMRDKFSGVPFVWCYLGNFGENSRLVGNLPVVKERIDNAFAACDNMIGLGSTSEGLDACNALMYDYTFERAWDIPEVKDLSKYVDAVADRHCGMQSEKARKAWSILLETVYAKDFSKSWQSSKVNVRPCIGKPRHRSRIEYSYDNADLLNAIKLLLEVDSKTDCYEFDLVNLTRDWLGNRFEAIFNEYSAAVTEGDIVMSDKLASELRSLIRDLDKILSCRSEFLLGKWIYDARNWGADEHEKLFFEKNARNLITTWGRPATGLNDYANRAYSGLISSYYGERWNMFFEDVHNALVEKGSFSKEDADAFDVKVKAFEGDWWENCVGNFSEKPSRGAKALVKKAVKKWE